jgi:hypothetical protein
VEISASNVGANARNTGDGVWLWIALYPDHTGDYAGADCIHTGSTLGHPGLNGAGSGNLTITGVALVNGMLPVTITVPDSYGHYKLASDESGTGDAIADHTRWGVSERATPEEVPAWPSAWPSAD